MKRIKQFTSRMLAVMIAGTLAVGSVSVSAFGAEDAGSTVAAAEEFLFDEATENSMTEATTSEVADEEVMTESSSAETVDEEVMSETSGVEEALEAGVTELPDGTFADTTQIPAEEEAVTSYTVTLDANGGYFANEWDDSIGDYVEQAEVVVKQIPVGGTVTTVPVFTDLDGQSMVFAGWSLERDWELIATGDDEYAPVESCVLYAVWKIPETAAEPDEVIGEEVAEQEFDDEYTEQIDATQETKEVEDTAGDAIMAEEGPGEEVTSSETNTALETEYEQDFASGQEAVYADEDIENTNEISSDASVTEGETRLDLNESFQEEETAREDVSRGIVESGTCGDNLAWMLDEEGTLTISGTGPMNSHPWDTNYSNDIKSVIIEKGVTNIYESAFSGCYSLESVQIANSIKNIQNGAFCNCNKLAGLTIPESVETIGQIAFSGCSRLTNVIIPNDVTHIEDGAFQFCNSLSTVTIPEGLTEISPGVFGACSSLKDIIIPQSIEYIRYRAFQNCNSLTTITIPSNVKYIGENAFVNCSGITNVYFDGNAPTIEYDAFSNVTATAYYPANDPTWTEDVRQNYGGNIKWEERNTASIDITSGTCGNNLTWTLDSEGVLTITGNGYMTNYEKESNKYAPWYDYRTEIKTIIFDDLVESIGVDAFYNCINLSKVSIGPSVKSIGSAAFKECDRLENVTIPSNVASIGFWAFSYCDNLKNVTICNGVKTIGSQAFSDCGSLEKIDIPDSVTSFGNGTFYKCYRLKKVVIGDGITNIGGSAFSRCTSLCELVIGERVATIENIAFSQCNSLKKIQLPVTISKIESHAFYNCTNIKEVFFTGSFPSIGADSFQGVTATAYYPANDPTWTEDVRQNYGGNITWVEWDPSATSNTNDTIIERVREYTSDDLYAQYNAITEDTTISGEERFHRMNSLLCNYGFTNPKEGIKYISNVIDKRYAYLMLTTDDAYCANNYVDWLNSGLLAGPRRALLFADGLIFNNEINDWLSFTTYAESEYPGVKKYKTMLYDFMDATSKKTEIESGIKFASDLASKSTGVGKIEAENIVNSLNACKTTAEEREILRRAESEGVFASLEEARDENGNILLNYELDESSGFGQFQKSMGYATKTISIASMTISDILDIIELDSKLATYSQYKRFLQEVIHDTSVPFQMRWAASLIIGELDEGYLGKIKDVAMDIIGQTELNSTIKKAVLNKIGASSLSGWLTVISIDSFFVNQITNIGDLVKNEAYVEGYNYLSKSYKNRLEESKAAFQQNPTEANAWEFYYNYNILYNLRHKGEEAYLKMSKIGGLAGKLFDFGYTDKKAVVDETLKRLEERCQFTFNSAQNIPESCQFASKAVVKCPVDVDVVSSDGTVMATLVDGEESDFTNSYGRFAVVYDYYSQDYYKVICLNENNDFTLRAKGNNKGLVSVELARADDVDQDIYVINNIPIESEEVLSASVEQITENSTITRYTADESEGTEEAVVITNDNYVPVDNITLNQEELVLAPGESALLNVTFEPADSTKQGVFWNSTDSDVASVTDGRIEAVSEGSAIIYCTSQDNSDLIKTCAVTVANPVYPIENFTVEGLEDKVYKGEAVNQNISLKNAENTLTEGVDYEVSYTDNTNVGTATVTITGKGNYTGTISKTFTISPASIAKATVSGISNKTYTGSAITQNPAVKVGDKTLKKGTDYTITYANNTKVGTATITITGKGNYTGTVSKTFKINGIPVSNAIVTGISNKIYTGSAITQNPTVKFGDKTLKKGTDYTITYANNTNVGTATVTITGKGNYTSKKNANFKINKAAQSITAKAKASSVSVGKTTAIVLTGAKGKKSYKSSNTAIATVSSAGKVTAKKVGTVKITATSAATANYKAASKTITIKVVPAATKRLKATNLAKGIKLTWAKVAGANGYIIYRNNKKVKTITKGATVAWSDTAANTNGTKYTYKVFVKASTGTSKLSRSVTIYRVTRPSASTVTNSAASKMTVKWGKNAKATGYQIQYSMDKTFKTGNKAVTVAGASAVSKGIGSLTKSKTYYVRIRTYKTVGSAKYWSVWSAAKSVKIAK